MGADEEHETEDWFKLPLQSASLHTDECVFQMLPVGRNNSHPKEHNNYVEGIVGMAQAAYWLTPLHTTLCSNLRSHCS